MSVSVQYLSRLARASVVKHADEGVSHTRVNSVELKFLIYILLLDFDIGGTIDGRRHVGVVCGVRCKGTTMTGGVSNRGKSAK